MLSPCCAAVVAGALVFGLGLVAMAVACLAALSNLDLRHYRDVEEESVYEMKPQSWQVEEEKK